MPGVSTLTGHDSATWRMVTTYRRTNILTTTRTPSTLWRVSFQPLVRERALVADSAPGGSLNGSTAMRS